MKFALLLLPWLLPVMAFGQLEIVPADAPPAVFAGKPATIKVLFHNPTDKPLEMEIQTRLFQATSAVLVPVADAQPWKTLRVLPKQTVLESFELTIPEIKAPSRFQIQWIGIGRTDVAAYPPQLLKRLASFTGDQPLAVFDPDDKLKPLFKQAAVDVADYETDIRDSRLAIVWSAARTLPESIVNRVKKGMAVVWIRPEKSPAAYVVHWESGVVVVVPQSGMTTLAADPLTQLTLLRYAELALQPDQIQLPADRKESQ